MAIKKNTSAKSMSTSQKSLSSAEGSEQEYALLRKLMFWGRNEASADLARLENEEPVTQARMLCAIAGLRCSAAYQSAVREYNPLVGEYTLLKLCGEMYMAGKMSANRYNPEALIS